MKRSRILWCVWLYTFSVQAVEPLITLALNVVVNQLVTDGVEDAEVICFTENIPSGLHLKFAQLFAKKRFDLDVEKSKFLLLYAQSAQDDKLARQLIQEAARYTTFGACVPPTNDFICAHGINDSLHDKVSQVLRGGKAQELALLLSRGYCLFAEHLVLLIKLKNEALAHVLVHGGVDITRVVNEDGVLYSALEYAQRYKCFTVMKLLDQKLADAVSVNETKKQLVECQVM